MNSNIILYTTDTGTVSVQKQYAVAEIYGWRNKNKILKRK